MSCALRLFVCALTVVAIAGVAQAATVELVLTRRVYANTWTLTAETGLDNGGISGFVIDLVDLGPAGQSFGVAPLGFNDIHGDLSELIPTGFWVGNGDSDPGQDTVTLFGVQHGAGPDLTDPISIIFGVGNRAGVTVDNLLGTGKGLPTTVPQLIAHGTGNWITTGFGANVDPNSYSANVNVFDVAGEVGASRAEVILITRIVPEPSTCALTAFAFLAALCPVCISRRSPSRPFDQ